MSNVAFGDAFQRYPLLRLVVSYLLGIVVADGAFPLVGLPLPLCIGLCASLLVAMACVYAVQHRSLQWTFGTMAILLFFSFGTLCYSLSCRRVACVWPTDEQIYEARVMEVPRSRAHSCLVVMQVRAVDDACEVDVVQRKVFAYLQPTDAASLLQPGDVVCFRGKVQSPQASAFVPDFDYPRYLFLQGVSGTIFLNEHQWKRVGEYTLSLRSRMLRLRQWLYAKHWVPAFDANTLGVMAAVVLGERSALDADTRAVYSDAGVSHLLALSGLHVGVIYGFLAFVMHRVLRRRMRWVCDILILGVLWLFAFLVGMSPSVLRAVVMCTLYTVGRWISRDSAPLHVLSLAAMSMLVVYPLYLFDVSFQLSFMAMVGIFAMVPTLERLFRRSSSLPLLAYPISVVNMSLAAQIGTLPLVLYHFGTFPTYFILANLIAVPGISLVLLIALCWWGMSLAHVPLSVYLGESIQSLVHGINHVLSRIAHWPYATLHVSSYSSVAVLFTYLFILFSVLFLTKKHSRSLLLSLFSLLCLLLVLLFGDSQPLCRV